MLCFATRAGEQAGRNKWRSPCPLKRLPLLI